MSSSKPSGSKTKRKIADEHRNFQKKWELEYFCSEVKDKIICLICNNAISVPKLYNIKRHYEQHKSKYDTYEGLMRQEKLKEFKLGMKKQQFMFTKVSQESEAAVHASYVLSEMIAKHSKPFTEGDFIKECLIKAAEIVCPGSVKTFQAISLSRTTVVERYRHWGRSSVSCFFRACDTDFNIFEELLELVPMHGTTTGEDIFNCVYDLLKKYNLPQSKLTSVATDGAPSMTGKTNGFVALLRKKLSEISDGSNIHHTHCIIHQEVLCTKRQFSLFLTELESEYSGLSYYTEVRWLSCSKVLKQFWDLKEEIYQFLITKNQDITLFSDQVWLQDFSFMVDITKHSGGTKGENRAMATEVGAIGYTNGKLLRGLDNRAAPQQSKTIKKPLGRFLRICQINVEGLTTAKTEILERMGRDENIDIFALQETHISEDHISRLKIPNYDLIAYENHPRYGLAILTKKDISNNSFPSIKSSHSISITHDSLTIHNIYKPPSQDWNQQVLPNTSHPSLYCGDFNSHHNSWGYTTTNTNGELLEEWANNNLLHLIYNPKQNGSFSSGRWNTRTNPDLCFVSTDHNNKPIPTTKRILKKFPKNQHHPIILEVGHFIPVTLKPSLPRWNLQKANWENFRAYIDQNINRIQPLPSNYFRFVGLLMKAGRKFIPRGHRKEYIPGWDKDTEELYRRYKDSDNEETAEMLINQLNSSRKEKWMQTVSNLDLTHSSRKGWDLLRKLGNAESTNSFITNITPNQIARHLQTASKVKIPKRKKKAMKAKIKEEFSKSNNSSHLSSQVTITEIETAIKLTKKYKAAGNDEIPAEFLIELGKRAKSWLARFFTIIMETGNIPKEWRQSKILAVLKPGKEPTCTANFRPIALLCTTHKLLERIILARLTPILDPEIPVEQAGFRGNRSCCDRVASLTSFIENGFQLGQKSAVVLLDLSSAYDTVWIDGLIYKLAKVLKCKQTLNLLSSLLSPRKFTVYLNSKSSKEYTIYNGLPQGSVLSPLLYNWYTHDIPQTTSKKFIYADDTAILAQAKTFEELEIQLNKDLETLHNYFENWSLRLNPAKAVHCCFHLNHHRAERKLNLFINNSQITHSEHPKYLGIHLDRTLTFKTHLTKLKGKLSSRNNILHKLAGSSWGSDANTLRTSALALIFSTAEYCAPVWEGSCHTKLIDTQLNSTLRIITGVCQPTRIDWLPVLAHISPPELRRKEATKKMYQKLLDSPDLEINPILQSPPKHRLKSRKPIWSRGNQLLSQNFNISEAWTNSWISSDIPNKNLITSPSVKIPGFFPPSTRMGQGRCAELMKLWGYTKDPNCACNVPQSMSHILDDCPLYKFNGGISNLHSVTPEALNWLKALPLRL
ncbi:hypothetical protein LAZ67_3001719 [Cordylochernes scorpioides]|uniref:Reverse transcriptase domain-containing protein n=1 Tax=Cordylochernes scorpioides TaxID=51811 RepID=A0ABY6K758_9ARAC|nr:hypothetical protein LAZ67_3001719 [Cordylochernes scorpioides]